MSEKIQKERRHLTIAELRKLKNYENVSEEQAEEILIAVKNLALIFYEHLNKRKREKEMEKESENKKPDSQEAENSETNPEEEKGKRNKAVEKQNNQETKKQNSKSTEKHSVKIAQ